MLIVRWFTHLRVSSGDTNHHRTFRHVPEKLGLEIRSRDAHALPDGRLVCITPLSFVEECMFFTDDESRFNVIVPTLQTIEFFFGVYLPSLKCKPKTSRPFRNRFTAENNRVIEVIHEESNALLSSPPTVSLGKICQMSRFEGRVPKPRIYSVLSLLRVWIVGKRWV